MVYGEGVWYGEWYGGLDGGQARHGSDVATRTARYERNSFLAKNSSNIRWKMCVYASLHPYLVASAGSF
jgi:hypothetical protein